MKERIRRFMRQTGEQLVRTLRAHPVEAALVAVGCAGCIVGYERNWTDAEWARLALFPLFFALALVLALAPRSGAGSDRWVQRLYYISWAPLLLFGAWDGLAEWVESMTYWVTLGVLAPLAVLMARWVRDNHRFVADATVYVRAAVLAVFFANAMLGLFGAVLYSTVYIFALTGEWVSHVWVYAVILAETLFAPVFLLMLTDDGLGRERRSSRVLDVLLNWIVTPAVLIYLAILWLYIVKIVAVWSLPRGGVAYLVFGFMLFAFLVRALQELVGKRVYDWFFDRFSWFALPAVVLFWVGVGRRVSEYGLTEGRVWLVACGAVMTFAMAAFLFRRTGRYLWVCAAAFLCFAALVYVPSLDPERIAVRSQEARANRIGCRLDLLDAEGKLRLRPVPESDSVRRDEYRAFYEALEYVGTRDEEVYHRFGGCTGEQVAELIPESFRHYVLYGYEDTYGGGERVVYLRSDEGRRVPVAGYRMLYTCFPADYEGEGLDYRFRNDTLQLSFGPDRPAYRIAAEELLAAQLEKIGADATVGEERLWEASPELLVYEDAGLLVLFSHMVIEWEHERPVLESLDVEAVLTR